MKLEASSSHTARRLWRRAFDVAHARFKEHRPFQLAAQIAFFFLLATQPLLIVFTALLAYLPLGALEQRVARFIDGAAPGPVGERLHSMIASVLEQRNPRLMSIAALGLLWTASSGTKAIIDATTRVHGLVADPRRWILVRLRAIALTVTLLVLVTAGAAVAGGALGLVRSALHVDAAYAYHRWVELALGFLLCTSGVQLIYRWGPPPEMRRPALPGAVVAVLAAIAASFGLSAYVEHVRDLNAIYGSLGAAVLLVLWFYVAGCALVLGAEVNALLAGRRRATIAPKAPTPRPALRS